MISEHDIEEEIWAPFPIAEFSKVYKISNYGRIQRIVSADRGIAKAGLILSAKPATNGYIKVGLRCGKKRKFFLVHRMVLLAFVGEPKEGEEACHFDGNRGNPRLSNLRWDIHKNNGQDMIRHGRVYSGHDHWTAKSNHRPWAGDNHWSKRNPEKLSRGDKHHSRTHPESLARGEKSPNHKLTNDGVIEIRRRYKNGITQVQLAKIYGVNQTIISDVVRRVTWKHI